MENIKDLKLIIGPLDYTEWGEVIDWSNKNCKDSPLKSHMWENYKDNSCVNFSYTDNGFEKFTQDLS